MQPTNAAQQANGSKQNDTVSITVIMTDVLGGKRE